MGDIEYEKPEFAVKADAINERAKYINLELNRRVEAIIHGIASENKKTKSEVNRLNRAIKYLYASDLILLVSFIVFAWFTK